MVREQKGAKVDIRGLGGKEVWETGREERQRREEGSYVLLDAVGRKRGGWGTGE